ncbi:MAG: bifunctional phosphoribosylaminoimidazolecarboxamide formyltransferase/IMP cyclohydrolase [Deltaproteobacteria bacterium RIFCSPHIGHO2_02_FULL_40_11]|nr:MAG: bifunctional phosphoribosylaminoimidazolecarboxamide formyltransferase/IMP cyclohydrolase [Deltaproteobacteria bacterium RIFCSPHIGHO2_02_FULL_40_11]
MKLKRALISVSDKSEICEFARALRKYKIELISTGGTAALLQKNNIKVTSVSDYTGFPEILGGRVKTLHPKVYGGILAHQEDETLVEKLKEFGISQINMVVVNLYPFEKTISNAQCTLEDAIENIDIGGVSLIRAASKNYKDVVVVTDPKDYALVLEEMQKNEGEVSLETKLRLAVKALSLTSHYDQNISNYLYQNTRDKKDTKNIFPPVFHLKYRKLKDLRYGENPHQGAAFYIDESILEPSVGRAHQFSGKELSFNNIYDLHAGLELIKTFENPTCVIVKHNNPCGVGCAKKDIVKAYDRALRADPVSAFGGIVVLNQKVTESLAEKLSETFFEVILAPGYQSKALECLQKKKNLRILALDTPKELEYEHEKIEFRKITGGLLVQERNLLGVDRKDWQVVAGAAPTDEILDRLSFAWKVVRHVKSNAIVIANEKETLGIGAGQMNRIEAVKLALNQALSKKNFKDAVLASDAFFPFRDSIDALKGTGVTAVIQPGGSIRDKEVIQAAKEHKITLVFTHERHFLH